MLGRLLYQYNVRFGAGFVTAYYRDIVRWRILNSPPITNNIDDRCEIHVLTSKSDWINLIWVLKSFYQASGKHYRLCIHEDGSLTGEDLQILHYHFPQSRLIDRRNADDAMKPVLRDMPLSHDFRSSNPLALKVYDFQAFLRSDRLFLLDSDVLFFRKPTVLCARLEDSEYRLNTLNKDWTNGYTVTPDQLQEHLDFRWPHLINSGLGLIHEGVVRPELCEHFLSLPGVLGHHHRIEQTLIALCCARDGFEFLPEEYDVLNQRELPSTPSRHYTGPIRQRMYREGMARLISQGLLRGEAAA